MIKTIEKYQEQVVNTINFINFYKNKQTIFM